MKMTTELATLAEAEEDIHDEDEEDDDGDDVDSNDNEDASSSEISTFDVPHFRYIDDDDAEEIKEEEREGGWRDGSGRSWCSREEDCCNSSSYRYVVVSGTPLKILEHLLSDLRLDDQRGAPESRESGKFLSHCEHTCLVNTCVREHLYKQCVSASMKTHIMVKQ